jgi:hypothetical protein
VKINTKGVIMEYFKSNVEGTQPVWYKIDGADELQIFRTNGRGWARPLMADAASVRFAAQSGPASVVGIEVHVHPVTFEDLPVEAR